MNHEKELKDRAVFFGELELTQNQFNHIWRSYNDFVNLVCEHYKNNETPENKQLFAKAYSLQKMHEAAIKIKEEDDTTQ